MRVLNRVVSLRVCVTHVLFRVPVPLRVRMYLVLTVVGANVGPVGLSDSWDIRFFDEDWRVGKSWFAGRYIREWKKQHPDGRVIVFSQVGEDKELDKCGITRVMIDEGLVDNPYELKELANCLVVFDDIDAIRDKKIKKVVTDLCDELQVRTP